MAIVTFTIGTTGRDYTTWAAAIAALPANLVTDGNSYVLEGYNDSEFTATGGNLITLTGHTTDSTHFITLTAGPGQSFRDTDSNALNYDQANGVACTSDENVIDCQDNWTVISNLQLKSTNVSAARYGVKWFANDCTMKDCISIGQSTTGSAAYFLYLTNVLDTLVSNCVFIQDNPVSPTVSVVQGYTARMYSCTFVAPSDSQAPIAAFYFYNSQAMVVENSAFFGSTDINHAGSSATITFTNCMTDNASPPSGMTGGLIYADQFENTTSATGNWRVVEGADLIGAGAFNASYPTDIFGVARDAVAPTVGAMEFPTIPALAVELQGAIVI